VKKLKKYGKHIYSTEKCICKLKTNANKSPLELIFNRQVRLLLDLLKLLRIVYIKTLREKLETFEK